MRAEINLLRFHLAEFTEQFATVRHVSVVGFVRAEEPPDFRPRTEFLCGVHADVDLERCVGGSDRRDEIDERCLVAITGKFAVVVKQFRHKKGAAALVKSILGRVRLSSGMREVKQKRAVAADDNIRVTAHDPVIIASAGLLQEIAAGLPHPTDRIIRAIHGQPLPRVNDHPIGVLPAENFRAFTAMLTSGFAFVSPRDEIG